MLSESGNRQKIDKSIGKKLVDNLQILSIAEQNELKIMAALYTTKLEQYKNEKLADYKNSIVQHIKFYKKSEKKYAIEINWILGKYSELIDKIIDQYNTRFIAIINEIYENSANEKISIANIKQSIDNSNKIKLNAALSNKANYEIILNECYRQLDMCFDEFAEKLDEVFCKKSNQMIVKRRKYRGFWGKIKHLLKKRNNADKQVFELLDVEVARLENIVHNESKKINVQTIKNIAVIKDAEIQTQNLFNQMVNNRLGV